MKTRWHIWRTVGAFADAVYVLHYADPPQGPDTNWETDVPKKIRDLDFWWGYTSGRICQLRPLYRRALAAHGYMVMGLEQACRIERTPRRRIRLRAGRFKPISAA